MVLVRLHTVTASLHGAAWKPPVCREARACRGPAVQHVSRYEPTGVCTYVCVCFVTVSNKIQKDASEAADAGDSGVVSK